MAETRSFAEKQKAFKRGLKKYHTSPKGQKALKKATENYRKKRAKNPTPFKEQGKRLKEVRLIIYPNLTLKEFMEKFQLSSAYRNWENGRTTPRYDGIEKLAEVFGTNTEEIISTVFKK